MYKRPISLIHLWICSVGEAKKEKKGNIQYFVLEA